MKTGQWLVNVFWFARMEFRTTRRLPRFWSLATIISATCIGTYVTACLYLVYLAPYYFPFVTATPKYLLSNIDPSMFLLFQIGLLFLAFDTRHRHERARIAEVLDSRPVSNLESFGGQLIGCSTLLWLVIAVNVLVLHSFGWFCQVFGFGFAEPIQPYSIFNLLVLDIPATLLAWCALTVFLGSVLKSRFMVFATGILLMLAYYFLVLRTPFSLLAVLSPLSNDSLYISDIVPEIASLPTIFVRIVSVIGAFLLVVVATLLTTRIDSSNLIPKVVVMSALALVTSLFTTLAVLGTTHKLEQVAKWREFHNSYSWTGNIDIVEISGNVHIDPAKHLEIDLTLSFDVVSPLDRKLVFTFNPAMAIQQLSINEQPTEFSFRNGLLEVSTLNALEDRVIHALHIRAEGVPNPRFAYLNSALDYESDPEIRSRTVKLFGTEGSIYNSKYVGLMPSVYWYPIPGAVKGGSSTTSMPHDYFDVDLTVELTRRDWNLVASGAIPDSNKGVYRVATRAPVSQIGLLASKFKTVELDIDDIEFSITLHERHAKNLVLANDLDEEIRSQVGLILNPLADHGFSYPSRFLNLVEVPSRLRTVGGGWRMETTNTLPGVVLLKEHGYPTAPLHRAEGRKVRRVFQYFQYSIGPDNPWSSFPHRFWTQVTTASGEHAPVLEQTVLSLLSQLTFTWDFFSVYSTLYVADMVTPNLFSIYFTADPFQTVAIRPQPQLKRLGDLEAGYSIRPSVQVHSETNSLAALPSEHGSQKDIEHLLFKSALIARGLEAINGREKVLAWLTDMRNTYAGSTFSYSDLLDLAVEHDVVVEPFLTEWITSEEVPGYVFKAPSVTQVSNDDLGSSRFQTTIEVRNSRLTAGYVKLSIGGIDHGVRINGLSSKRINIVTRNPPAGPINIDTGLSLNRSSNFFTEQSLQGREIKRQLDVNPAPFEEESDWIPTLDGIVVDDLDPGFRTFQKIPKLKRTNMPVYLGGLFEPRLSVELDHGLPVLSWYPEDYSEGRWHRKESSAAFGVFRKTYATAWNRNGLPRARFSVDLPSTGAWNLEYHIPEIYLSWSQQVDYDLALTNNGDSFNFTIEAQTMSMGWNSIHTFDLEKGIIDLDIVGSPKPTELYADAIRWTRVETDESTRPN